MHIKITFLRNNMRMHGRVPKAGREIRLRHLVPYGCSLRGRLCTGCWSAMKEVHDTGGPGGALVCRTVWWSSTLGTILPRCPINTIDSDRSFESPTGKVRLDSALG